LDPVVERDRDRSAVPSFDGAMVSAHAALKEGWAEKGITAFLSSLREQVIPTLGDVRVDQIESSHIRGALAPIWTAKPEVGARGEAADHNRAALRQVEGVA
jgi:hypothetical protein